jgi:large subunit ribosomal protein L47
MEHNAREACRLFPSPERIDKVQDSMDRLEEVVRERNEAFWKLEVGEEAPKGKTERSLDPNDPLAAVREPIKAVLDGLEGRRAGVKFQQLVREKEMKMQTKLLR